MELTCDRLAIDSTTRPRYDVLRWRLGTAVISFSELEDGFVFQLDEKLISHQELSEWMSMERLCCPFFSFEVKPVESAVLELRLTGPAGSKTVLLAEFGNSLKTINCGRQRCKEWVLEICLG